VPAAATAQPTVAAVSAAAATPAAAQGAPRRGGMLMTATQTDWITFDNIYNSANGSAAFMVFDPLFFFRRDERGAWGVAPGLIER